MTEFYLIGETQLSSGILDKLLLIITFHLDLSISKKINTVQSGMFKNIVAQSGGGFNISSSVKSINVSFQKENALVSYHMNTLGIYWQNSHDELIAISKASR